MAPFEACPVCRYEGPDAAAYEEIGCPTYEICPCCGTQFGYDDFALTHAELRARWIEGGAKWWASRPAPAGGDPARQLARQGGAAETDEP